MGASQSHRDIIPDGETPEFVQLNENASVVTFQGYRSAMEDAYDACLGTEHGDLYAVFDGHGGKDTVTYVKKNLLKNMASMPRLEGNDIRQAFVDTERQFKASQKARQEFFENEWNKAVESAVKDEIISGKLPETKTLDTSILQGGGSSAPPPLQLSIASPVPEREKVDDSGACCMVAIVRQEEKGKVVTVAGVGDCTALLVLRDKTFESVIAHHKPLPGNETEVLRILRAGLFVTGERVNGELAVSRSMGDFQYKGMFEEEEEQAVTCVPSIISLHIDPSIHSCLLLFSDGVSDGVENEELAHLAVQLLEDSKDGRMASMKASLLTSYEKSRDNQVLLRIDF
jgi:serine/threonine protein phosphatase PrpC